MANVRCVCVLCRVNYSRGRCRVSRLPATLCRQLLSPTTPATTRFDSPPLSTHLHASHTSARCLHFLSSELKQMIQRCCRCRTQQTLVRLQRSLSKKQYSRKNYDVSKLCLCVKTQYIRDGDVERVNRLVWSMFHLSNLY